MKQLPLYRMPDARLGVLHTTDAGDLASKKSGHGGGFI